MANKDKSGGLILQGTVFGRTRKNFPAREGLPARVLVCFTVNTGSSVETVEHWGDLPAADCPAVGSTVALPVRVRCFAGGGRAQYRLCWGAPASDEEAF
jgi:hypothetical protein